MARESLEIIRMKGAKAEFGDGRTSEFRSAAEAAPFTLRSMGLGAGIATLAAKEDESRIFAAMLARWLLTNCPYSPYLNTNEKRASDADWVRLLLERIGEIGEESRANYRTAQIEAIAFAVWLKRLAQALIEKNEAA